MRLIIKKGLKIHEVILISVKGKDLSGKGLKKN